MATQDLGGQLLQYKGTLRTLIWLFKTDQPDAWCAFVPLQCSCTSAHTCLTCPACIRMPQLQRLCQASTSAQPKLHAFMGVSHRHWSCDILPQQAHVAVTG